MTSRRVSDQITRSMLTVYQLIDPRTNEPRYVGATKQTVDVRLRQHILAATSNASHYRLYGWIRELAALSLQPRIEALQERAYLPSERKWVRKLLREGRSLLNQQLVDKKYFRPAASRQEDFRRRNKPKIATYMRGYRARTGAR